MRYITTLLLIFISASLYAQNITGSWYGKADVMVGGSHNNYLTELILKQKGNEIEGVFGYYFRDGYKSFFIRGSYSKKYKQFLIDNLPVTYFRANSIEGVDCIMDFTGMLMISKAKTNLLGLFEAHPKYKYTCPEIKVSYTLDALEADKQDSLIKTSVGKKVWQPLKEDLVVADTKVVNAGPATVIDSISAEEKEVRDLVDKMNKRKKIVSRDIEVDADSVRISFYDNGEVDGDSISLFMNNKPILTKKAITAEAFNIYLALDKNGATTELTMFAENLGKYPPNTALMVVYDGTNRYEVYVSSNLTQNASVRLKRKKQEIKIRQ